MSDLPGNDCTIALMPSGRRGRVQRGTNLLEAARQLGVEIESICAGRQTCGKCQISVEAGHFPKHALTSSPDHLTAPDGREAKYLDQHELPPGRRLACACEVRGDLLIVVPEESQARKQIVAKAATDRAIDVEPAVRQVYVEVEPATLESHGGDWERLQAALLAEWKLSGWQRLHGRAPTPEDRIVPTRGTLRPRHSRNAYRQLHYDCERLGIRPRRMHGTRHTLVSLLIDDGAKPRPSRPGRRMTARSRQFDGGS